MAYKDKTLIRAYAENKRERIRENKIMAEEVKQDIIRFVYSIENDYLAHMLPFDEAMENIACAEDTVLN